MSSLSADPRPSSRLYTARHKGDFRDCAQFARCQKKRKREGREREKRHFKFLKEKLPRCLVHLFLELPSRTMLLGTSEKDTFPELCFPNMLKHFKDNICFDTSTRVNLICQTRRLWHPTATSFIPVRLIHHLVQCCMKQPYLHTVAYARYIFRVQRQDICIYVST
jgi:hypothetical protein